MIQVGFILIMWTPVDICESGDGLVGNGKFYKDLEFIGIQAVKCDTL